MKVKSESEVAQSCPTLRDPTDCSPPGSSVPGSLQAGALEWGAIAFSLQVYYAVIHNFKGYTPFRVMQNIGYIPLVVQYILVSSLLFPCSLFYI